MPERMVFYVGGSSGTQATVQAYELEQRFAWLNVPTSAPRQDPYVSPRMAQEIRDALAAVERGEIEDLDTWLDDED